MTNNMAAGSPARHILTFGGPMLVGMLFQQMYSMVDSVIVGQLLGPDPLAAVGATGSISFLVLGFCMGITAGFAIPVAMCFGAGDYGRMRRFVGGSIWLCLFFAAGLTAATTALCRPILLWMQTPADIFEDAYGYIFIIFLSIPAALLYNMVSGVIRSLGDSRTPVLFLIGSSLLNIGLDLFFLVVLRFGVEGAGWATLISQAVSGVGCLFWCGKKCSLLRLSRAELRPDRRVMGRLLAMGLPMGLQYSITAIGCSVLQAFLNGLGTAAVTASTAASKLGLLLCCPFDALGSTMATYCGQNVGAGQVDRLRKGIGAAGLIGSVYAVAIFAVTLLWSDQLSLLFLKPEETALVSLSGEYMILQAAFYIPLVFVNVLRFGIQGMGFSLLAVLAGVLEMAARAAVGIWLVPRFGYTAACLGSPAAWLAADAFLIPACVLSIRTLRRRFRAAALRGPGGRA